MRKATTPGSSLFLGGAQVGNNYGITASPRPLQTLRAEGIELLQKAYDEGVKTIDTAPSYGESELAIGDARWPGKIHTKLQKGEDPVLSVRKSVKRLRRTRVECLYLFHSPEDWPVTSKRLVEAVVDSVSDYADSVGVSLYDVESLDFFAEIDAVRWFQFPYNALDRRFEDKITPLANAGKKVVLRSVFAQGLLLAPRPAGPDELFPFLRAWHKVANHFEVKVSHLALSWALSRAAEAILVGAQNASELGLLVRAWRDLPVDDEVLNALSDLPTPPAGLMDPRGWSL